MEQNWDKTFSKASNFENWPPECSHVPCAAIPVRCPLGDLESTLGDSEPYHLEEHSCKNDTTCLRTFSNVESENTDAQLSQTKEEYIDTRPAFNKRQGSGLTAQNQHGTTGGPVDLLRSVEMRRDPIAHTLKVDRSARDVGSTNPQSRGA